MKQIDLKEGARRQHRAVALFATLQCWIRGLDGVCLQRRHLSRLIGLDRFKGKRIEWLKKDFSEFFEFQQLCVSGPADSLASLFVSRTSLATMPTGTMPDEQRIASIPEGGPRLGIFQLWQQPNIIYAKRLQNDFAALLPLLTDRANYDERLLSAYTSLIFTGQMSLRSLTNALPKPEDDE
jgi:hypothetical protein